MRTILYALAALVGSATYANADPFTIGASITALLSTSIIGSVTIGSVVVGAALSVGLNYASRLLQGGGAGAIQSSAPAINDPAATSSTRQAAPPKRVIYGQVHVGGALFFEQVKPPYLYRGYLIADHLIDSIEKVFIGTNEISFSSLAEGSVLTPLAVDGQPAYPTRLQISVRRGSDTQTIDPLIQQSTTAFFPVVSGATGTPLGNLTSGGGLAAAFNGTNVQTQANSASANPTGNFTGILGKDWGSGNSKVISKFSFYAPSNVVVSSFPITVTLEGSNDNFVSDIHLLATLASASYAANSSATVSTGIDTTTAYRYHRLNFAETGGSGAHSFQVSQVVFYEYLNQDFRQRGIATVVVRYHYGTDWNEHQSLWGVSGDPTIFFVVNGLAVYDPRDPTQDVADETTWRFSNNATLVQNDYLRRDFGGRIDYTKIPYDRVALDADYDDGLIYCLDGTYIKRYTCDGLVLLNQSPADVLGGMQTANRGKVVQDGGYVWAASSRPLTSCATIYDDILAGGIDYQNDKAKRDVVNTVQTRFISEDREYNLVDGPLLQDATQVSDDGEILTATLSLPFTRDYRRVERLQKAFRDTSRLGKTLTVPVDIRILAEATDRLSNNCVTQESDLFPSTNDTYQVGQLAFAEGFSTLTLTMNQYLASIETDWIASRDEMPFTVAALNVT